LLDEASWGRREPALPKGRGFFTTRLSLALWCVGSVTNAHNYIYKWVGGQQLLPCPFEAPAESTWARPAFLHRPCADTSASVC
jgi:hypothetical protein